MSTEENKTMIRRMTEEVTNKGNLAVVDEVVAPNLVSHALSGEEIKGPEGIKQMITTMRTAFPDLHSTIDGMVAEGDMVASRNTMRGTFKGEYMGIAPTGKQFTIKAVTFHRFEGGKEVESWIYSDILSWYQQMGVKPPME